MDDLEYPQPFGNLQCCGSCNGSFSWCPMILGGSGERGESGCKKALWLHMDWDIMRMRYNGNIMGV